MDNIKDIARKKALLFTGHMIDAEDREVPRFPKEREHEIREKIEGTIKNLSQQTTDFEDYIGISGGACGGDLLFLEVCKELGIKRKMMLALPPEKFIAESVAFAGASWVARFYNMYGDTDTEVNIFSEENDSPLSVPNKNGYSFWEQNNLWLLNTALSYGPSNVTLIAVWDGKGGDGPGGTRHMIQEVKEKGAESLVIGI